MQKLGQFLELPQLEQPQVIGHDLPGYAALAVAAFDLQQQALAQVGATDARGIECVDHAQRLRHIALGVAFGGGDFRGCGCQVPVFIQVPKDASGGLANLVGEYHER